MMRHAAFATSLALMAGGLACAQTPAESAGKRASVYTTVHVERLAGVRVPGGLVAAGPM